MEKKKKNKENQVEATNEKTQRLKHLLYFSSSHVSHMLVAHKTKKWTIKLKNKAQRKNWRKNGQRQPKNKKK